MKKDTARALMIVVAVVILLAVLGLGSAVWLFTSSVELGKADEAGADRAFADVQRRFAGVQPVLDVQEGETVLMRQPPDREPEKRLTTLHVLAWDSDDEDLARIDLPFWLLRLKSGPIEIGSDVGNRGELNLTVEDLERYGPTLILNHAREGRGRVIVWTE